MTETAKRTALATLVVIGLVAVALALWKLKSSIALVFLGLILAAAMRPGIEALKRRGLPRGAGLALHYLAFAGLIALVPRLVVPARRRPGAERPRRHDQGGEHRTARPAQSKGIKHDILTAIDKRLRELPKAGEALPSRLSRSRRRRSRC